MRADSLGRWSARCAVVCALGAAALAFAAGPAAADSQGPSQSACVDLSNSAVTTYEAEWGSPPPGDDTTARLAEAEWG